MEKALGEGPKPIEKSPWSLDYILVTLLQLLVQHFSDHPRDHESNTPKS